MARDLTSGFSSQIRFVVNARGDDLKAVEPVLVGVLAQTMKESELGGRVALRMFEQTKGQTRPMPESLAKLLIFGWLHTENKKLERSFAYYIQNSRLNTSSDSVVASCLRDVLKDHDEYLKARRNIGGTELLRDREFREKLVRFVTFAEVGCQSETVKVAAYMYLRRCSPAAIVDLFKLLPA
ncbi:MAG: hypothetical protein AAB737_00030 [Patescibacteria group bacterium]